jgi:hypothetical protein
MEVSGGTWLAGRWRGLCGEQGTAMTAPSDAGDANGADGSGLERASSVSDFFDEVVTTVVDEQRFPVTHEGKAYVTALLAEHAAPQASEQLLRQPMGTSLLIALQTHSAERFNRLRRVGDEALFVSGFFSEHLSQRGLELSYASDLGRVAYDGAAQLLRRLSQSSAPDVFSELSGKFGMFVELLHVVADSLYAQAATVQSAYSPESLLELYERWRRSGSQRLGDVLVQRGIMPVAGDPTLH